jgi:hypothetical protein
MVQERGYGISTRKECDCFVTAQQLAMRSVNCKKVAETPLQI